MSNLSAIITLLLWYLQENYYYYYFTCSLSLFYFFIFFYLLVVVVEVASYTMIRREGRLKVRRCFHLFVIVVKHIDATNH